MYIYVYIFLTLNLLTTTIVAPPSNASKWQMGFNSACKGLTAEKVPPIEIHRRMQAVYGDQCVDVSTVRRWVRRFKDGELGQADLSDKILSGRPVTASDQLHQDHFEELIL